MHVCARRCASIDASQPRCAQQSPRPISESPQSACPSARRAQSCGAPKTATPPQPMNQRRFVARSKRETLLPNPPHPLPGSGGKEGSAREGKLRQARQPERWFPSRIRRKNDVFLAKSKNKSNFPQKSVQDSPISSHLWHHTRGPTAQRNAHVHETIRPYAAGQHGPPSLRRLRLPRRSRCRSRRYRSRRRCPR